MRRAPWGAAAATRAPRSAHYDVFRLQYDFDRALDDARALGLADMVVKYPRAGNGVCPTLIEWRWNAEFLNTIGGLVKRAGLRLGYHNHNIEFTRYDDKGRTRTGLDEMLAGTDPAAVPAAPPVHLLHRAAKQGLGRA